MKPVIGIFPSYNDETKQVYIDNVYSEEIINSGGIPFILPVSFDREIITESLNKINGLILSGGTDIDPVYYGEENTGKSLNISPVLDQSEKVYIEVAMERDIPVLGICRGMQALNVFCSGSLIQDIPSEHGFSVVHNLTKPEIAFHDITVEKQSPLSDAIGFGKHIINSYHHQAVKELSLDFSIAATSEDGIIESIYRKDKKFVLGVQWHPERNFEKAPDNKKIIDYFVKICSE